MILEVCFILPKNENRAENIGVKVVMVRGNSGKGGSSEDSWDILMDTVNTVLNELCRLMMRCNYETKNRFKMQLNMILARLIFRGFASFITEDLRFRII